ncbi:MAG: N-acetylmuramoyl-L-alanine amidase [Pseudomonadota bacterium]
MTKAIIDAPSPNHDDRGGQYIDILLIHYTGMLSGPEALARLCDPAAKVSAHYLIEEDGRLFKLVDEDRRAWHAGVAHWDGASDINARSIGIELVNPGHEFGYRAFPKSQMACLTELSKELISRHAIPAHRVLGHSDVAPARKEDPGELFDWAGLAADGVGLWPQEPLEAGGKPDNDRVARLLQGYGYGLDGQPIATVVTAFQRHFQPGSLTGQADSQTIGILEALLALKK